MNSPPLLTGVGVLVTRPEHQAANLCRLLESHGAAAIRFPGLVIAEHPTRRAQLAQLAGVPNFDVVIFISSNAVRFGGEILAERRDMDIAAVGPATARALNQAGYRVSIEASGGFDSEHLLAHPRFAAPAGLRILIVKGDGGRDALEQTLKQRGARVQTAVVYERRPPAPAPAGLTALTAQFDAGQIQLITATSLDVATHLFALARDGLRTHFENTAWVAPSERVAFGISRLGARLPIIRAASAEDQELVGAVLRWRSTESGA